MSAEDDAPRLVLPVGPRDHVQGASTAGVTLLEYGDYECPYCGAAYPIVKELQKRVGAAMKFVFRNFPLENAHPHAKIAAESAEVVGATGKFWEMHDTLYENQDALEPEDLLTYAERLGVPRAKFTTEVKRPVYDERIREDFTSGVRSGVNGTPTFYINGVRHNGSYELEELLDAVNSAGSPSGSSSAASNRSRSPRKRTVG
jgi:protein-disulfide isomerase